MGKSSAGRTLCLYLNVGHREPMKKVQSATFVAGAGHNPDPEWTYSASAMSQSATLEAGTGIEGDRHFTDREQRQYYTVLLMDQETLQELGLEPGIIKENITSTGIDVASLEPGQQVALGDEVVIQISKPCAPCSRMDEIRPGLQDELDGRRGMLASVVTGGTVNVGDTIRVC